MEHQAFFHPIISSAQGQDLGGIWAQMALAQGWAWRNSTYSSGPIQLQKQQAGITIVWGVCMMNHIMPLRNLLPVISARPFALAWWPFLPFFSFPFLPFCLPHSDCYFNDCLSGTVKLKVEQKLEQIGKLQGVWLHTAHVLCMDAILSVGLEMGSHNPDCWPHVFRYIMGSSPPHGNHPILGAWAWWKG